MANVKADAPGAVSAPPPRDDKWIQQVRLSCIQAAAARAVASKDVWDADLIIGTAARLARFVVEGD